MGCVSSKNQVAALERRVQDLEAILAASSPAVPVTASRVGGCLQFEDPASLPFSLPKSLDDVTAHWMQEVLHHRGTIAKSCEVVSIVKSGAGMTAGYFSSIAKIKCNYSEKTSACTHFVCKAWPEMELLPKEGIRTMFINDMKGYSNFSSEDWFPRPDVYLVSFDAEADRWALLMEDVGQRAEHCEHDNPMTLERVRKMIPALVHTAVKFEGVGDEDHPQYENAKHIPSWVDVSKSVKSQLHEGAMLIDSLLNNPTFGAIDDKTTFAWPKMTGQVPHKPWDTELGGNYTVEFAKSYEAFWARCDVANGATQTISHGDLRGDNLFWDTEKDTWLTIDYQLVFKGPICSDLAYLMSSGTVLPDVYENHTDEICREFYDQFIRKTKKYKDLSFAQFEMEFQMMCHVMFTYYAAFGAPIFKAGCVDHDGGVACADYLGSGAVQYADMPPEERRKRSWWYAAFRNLSHLFKHFNTMELLQSLPREEVDFKAAFDIEGPRGCPWPGAVQGTWEPVDAAMAVLLSDGALTPEKAEAISKDGKVTIEAFLKAIPMSWSSLYKITKGGQHDLRKPENTGL